MARSTIPTPEKQADGGGGAPGWLCLCLCLCLWLGQATELLTRQPAPAAAPAPAIGAVEQAQARYGAERDWILDRPPARPPTGLLLWLPPRSQAGQVPG